VDLHAIGNQGGGDMKQYESMTGNIVEFNVDLHPIVNPKVEEKCNNRNQSLEAYN
jgi:hypothetical protein